LTKSRSSRKSARVVKAKQARNVPIRSAARNIVGKAEKLVSGGDTESAQVAVAKSVQALDRAAQKGVIHPNNAARRKSRLVKKLNVAMVSPRPQRAKKKKETASPKPKAEETQDSAES
jgi:small subunit ribosomal protein S20